MGRDKVWIKALRFLEATPDKERRIFVHFVGHRRSLSQAWVPMSDLILHIGYLSHKLRNSFHPWSHMSLLPAIGGVCLPPLGSGLAPGRALTNRMWGKLHCVTSEPQPPGDLCPRSLETLPPVQRAWSDLLEDGRSCEREPRPHRPTDPAFCLTHE